ncbi:MAG: DUF368 domain-containing protein [Gammaproteobacteria bacterium]|nr:DUF368 domain-containing protein [Gammaproteobacteria bacterium]
MKDHLVIAAKGFCMGAADVVPGVSGGTMAFILGIYQRLVEAIRAFDVQLLRLVLHFRPVDAARHVDLVFLLPLLVGIFSAILFFTRVVPLPTLIHTHAELIYGLFFGLILASVVVLMAEIGQVGWRGATAILAGVAAGFTLVNLVPVETPETSWFVFVSGSIAITAMILPGISGSFMLLIMRKYAYVLDAVGRLDFTVILPFALGAVVGLLVFSRVLTWLLHHYYRLTLLVISGILIGSLWIIWPFQERIYETVRGKTRVVGSSPIWPADWNENVWLSLSLLLAGFAAVMALHWLSRRRPTPG